jgi:hypothetical protein
MVNDDHGQAILVWVRKKHIGSHVAISGNTVISAMQRTS